MRWRKRFPTCSPRVASRLSSGRRLAGGVAFPTSLRSRSGTSWILLISMVEGRLRNRPFKESLLSHAGFCGRLGMNAGSRVPSPSVRVANELGRGNAKAAKFSIKVLLGTSIAIGLFFFVLCLIFGKKLAYVFTDDERVADTVSDLSLLLSFSVLLNSIYPVLSGVAVGAGMQGTVAIVNLVCFYLIGIPIGALLGYLTDLQVKGIWIGMIGGVVTQTVALVYMAWATDWDDQVKKASERLNRFYVKSSEVSE